MARVKHCAECGQEFHSVRRDARYCSTRCRTAATRRRQKVSKTPQR